jgi:hypothetical protein
MASPHEKLAKSLKALRALQDHGVVAVRSGDLTRTHRERLVKNGFLQGVMKGWYIPARPDEAMGESTAWYAVRIILGLLCSLFAGAVWDKLEPLS